MREIWLTGPAFWILLILVLAIAGPYCVHEYRRDRR